MSVFTTVKRSREWVVFLVACFLMAACMSDDDLPPVELPEVSNTTSPPPVTVRVDGDSIFLPDDLYPTQIGLAASKYWILTQDEPIDPDTPGSEVGTLLAVDVDSGRVLSELILEDFPSHLLADELGVWVAHWGSGNLTRIDPGSAEIVAIIELELPFDVGNGPDRRLFIPNDMALGHGSLWVGTARGAVARIDVAANEVEIIELEPGAPGEIAVDEDGIWIAEDVAGLRHINAGTGEETRIGLDDLDHSVSRFLVVGDDLYTVGDRLARTQDDDFRIADGSYIASEEYVLSRVQLGSMTVVDTVRLQSDVAFIGWVDRMPGFIDSSGMFQRLEPIEGLVGEIFHTDGNIGWPLGQVGEEAWVVVHDDSLVRRLKLTESGGFALPFVIDDEMEPRPISDEVAVFQDWIELDRGPIDPRWPAIAVWTGDEIVIWGGEPRGGGFPLEGGAAYRPETDSWRMMSDSPLGAVSEPGWVWTGEELVIWDGRGIAAAWQPEDDTWRTIDDWPLAGWFYRRSLWTGAEILDVFRDLAVDPGTGESRPIAVSPPLHQRASVVWADGYMVSTTGEGSYHLASDSWTEMPSSGLTPLATDGTAVGSQVVAVDYAMSASVFDPDTNSWSRLPDVPLRFFECAPRAHTLGKRAVVEHCAGLAVLDPGWERWTPLAYPLVGDTHHPPTVIIAGGDVYVWGTGFFRLSASAIDDPSRVAVGISYLDLPDGWSAGETLAEEDLGTEVAVESSEGEVCFVSERHVSAIGHLRLLMRHDPIVSSVTPYVGGEPVHALYLDSGQLDDRHHLVWASSTSDVVDIACDDLDTLLELAPRVWSPWQ